MPSKEEEISGQGRLGVKQRAFLAAFRETCNVRLACESAGVGRSSHGAHQHRRLLGDSPISMATPAPRAVSRVTMRNRTIATTNHRLRCCSASATSFQARDGTSD